MCTPVVKVALAPEVLYLKRDYIITMSRFEDKKRPSWAGPE
jgi:hypothetical protein